MIPNLYIPTYTVQDWKLWEGDWELIKGTPVAMSPSPLNKHQLMGSDLHVYFYNMLRETRLPVIAGFYMNRIGSLMKPMLFGLTF